MIRISDLLKITHGKFLAFYEDSPLTVLLTDSRKASAQEGAIFFAIKGARHDGHDYITELYNRGIRQFVIEYTSLSLDALPGCNILQVPNSVTALQDLVTQARLQFSLPVIGITGSNGKTIIKEWLYQMLSKSFTIVKNPGSYNSQIGVPLSVWQLQSYHQLGIFEAGISRKGEMEKLKQIIQPTLGIFSNIGTAHDEGFATVEEKILEKLKLFSSVEKLIYCKDHAVIDGIISTLHIPTFSWGDNAVADLHVKRLDDSFHIEFQQTRFILKLPFTDEASIENCLHCVALMVCLNFTFEQIQESINGLRSVPMRLELKEGINHCKIVDDTYNNDLAGIEISLQFLSHQKQKNKKRLILSDVLESGMAPHEWVKQINILIQKNNINHFVGIGPVLSTFQETFPKGSKFFLTTQQFLNEFTTDDLHEEVILIKGARAFRFENIVNKLQSKVHGTVMEIDLGALVNNLNFFKSLLKPSTKLMVMVKAFAYGSGSNEVANILQYHQVDYLGVAYTDEGVDLRKNNITLPIMVMNPSPDSFDQIISYNLEPEIYNFKILKDLILYLKGKNCKIHLKLDTGMRRLGFDEADVKPLLEILQAHPNLVLASIFSHLAGADDEQHDDFTKHQATLFLRTADNISSTIGYKPLYHILNTPGILRLPSLQLDMVRLGIGLYGVDPTVQEFYQLKPVATLKTIISQIKKVRKGETIGYGRRGIAERDMILGTIAIGYADGFSRAFSRGIGEVSVKGKRAKVIGNVCMDMTMIDLTDIDAQEGDTVIIFGKELPIQEIAAKVNTISYEILANTSERVKRVFVAESI